jgi:hypothetical protein
VEEAWTRFVDEYKALPLYAFSLTPGVENIDQYSLIIQTDASLTGIGYATFVVPRLSDEVYDNLADFRLQEYSDSMKIISVGSRRLTSAEVMYLAHDREGLGIYHALSANKNLVLIFGRVILQSDSKTALSKYNGNELPKDVITSASTNRGRRWMCWLQDLSMILTMVHWAHVQGKNNCLADYLSRYAMADLCFSHQASQTEDVSAFEVGEGMGQVLLTTGDSMVETNHEVTIIPESPNTVDETQFEDSLSLTGLQNATGLATPEISRCFSAWDEDDSSLYLKDIKLQSIYHFLKGEGCDNLPAKELNKVKEVCKRRFSLFDNGYGQVLLFHNSSSPVIVVPNVKMSNNFPIRTYLIKYVHEVSPLAAHRARDSCMSILRKTVWFPRMDQAIKSWVNSCLPCTLVKSNKTSGTFNPRKLQYVNELIVCDWAGPLPPSPTGHRFCLLIVDAFSSFVYTQPFKTKTARDAVEGILSYAALFGFPEKFSSDNDPSFVSELITQFREVVQLANESVPTYSPASSGSAEAAVKRIKQAIAIFSHEAGTNVDWTTLIKGVTFCANATPKYNSGICAFEIMLGRVPTEPLSVLYGAPPERTQSLSSEEEYVTELKTKLQKISIYWRSKVMEERNKAADASIDDQYICLKPGDICIRVAYISGRRRVLGRVKILKKVEGSTSLFNILSYASNKQELAHGYQLIKEVAHPDRQYPAPATPVDYESFYPIERVLEYHPTKGYLVHWRGYPASERSWQRPADMPEDFTIREEMKIARERYRSSR